MEGQNKKPESYNFSIKMFIWSLYVLVTLGFVYLLKLAIMPW